MEGDKLSMSQYKEILELIEKKFNELIFRIDEKFGSHQAVCKERFITKDEFFKWQITMICSLLMSGFALGVKIYQMIKGF